MQQELTKDERKALRQETEREKMERERKYHFWKIVALWSLAGMLLVLALWALVAFSTGSTQQTQDFKLPAVTQKDFQTNPNAKTVLVEYADFQCPACKAYHPVVAQLESVYGTKLNVVYRMFPLKTIHQNAINSARAAYAASRQNAFWPMHDKLFDQQDSWAALSDPESVFIKLAKDAGLNTDQFKKDYESSDSLVFVNTSYDNATAMGLNSTPTFFLNGQHIENPQSYDDFKKLIDSAMK
ncbi:MAG TPA: thioredoxin domain-containing protein [Patescibacteria group bacterium]|nr:thioredoxin domain-containing protein [Patescibacteria group bacterium]